jgi:hypothetical protein
MGRKVGILHNRALGFIGFLVVMFALGFGCLRTHEHDGPWPCAQHSDCLLGEKCLARVCVPEKYCDIAADCAKGQACNAHECITGECVSDFDCAFLKSCVAFKCVWPDGG